jgi:hypothetical protein
MERKTLMKLFGATVFSSPSTQTVTGSITPRAVTSIRRLMMKHTKGVFQADTSVPFYYPVKELEQWCDVNLPIFFINRFQKYHIIQNMFVPNKWFGLLPASSNKF